MTDWMNLGKKIPEELSVVGYDDRELSSYYKPPLTTIRLPLHDIGYRAAEVMIAFAGKTDCTAGRRSDFIRCLVRC